MSWEDEPSLSLKERIAGTPPDGLVKGWLVHSIVENAKRHGVELVAPRRYFGFKDYPVAEYLALLAQAAVRVDPLRPPADTLRKLGRAVYPSFAGSIMGKVILAALPTGHDGARTGLTWITRVYKMTSNHAVARFTEHSEHTSVIHLENVWSFPDTYHVGIFEGAAQGFGGDVIVRVERKSLSAADLTFTWVDS